MFDGRSLRFGITLLVVAALFMPVWRNADSFPLSTQPMYSAARQPVQQLVSAVAVDTTGRVDRLSLDLIARTDDPLIAQAYLRDAIGLGRADEVCAEIAARVARSDRAGSVDRVDVVTETIELIAFATGSDRSVERLIHATCEIER